MDKIVVTNVYSLPDTSWYKPIETKNSPRAYDKQIQKRKKIGWLPKRVRKHPKIKRIFGKPRRKPARPSRPFREKAERKGERFNQLVEKAHRDGKL